MAGYIGSKAVSVNTTSATISDDLAVGDDLAVTDDATIGGTLDVTGAAHFGADVDLLQGNHIRFKHAAGGTIRASISAESDDDLQFNTGSSETARMTIATDGSASFSGNVSFPDGAAGLPSVSNNGDTNTGMYFPASDALGFSTAGSLRLVLNAAHMGMDTDGAYFQVAGSSNNFWAIGSTGGNNAPGTASTTLGFHHYNGSAWNNEVEFDVSGNITLDGNIKVASGKGIDFSATSDGSGTDTSELLDDYEEGTWTAVLTAGTSAPSTEVSTTGNYVKIGQVVHVFMRFSNANTGGASGVMLISGLPYASSNVTEQQTAVPMMHNLTVSEKYVTAYISGNRTIINFINVKNNAAWTDTQINATTGVYLNMNMTYRVP